VSDMAETRQWRSLAPSTNLARLVGAALLAAGLAAAGPLQAAPAADSQAGTPQAMTPAQRKQLQEFRQTSQELAQIQRKLEKIRREALQNHPDLQKKQKAFGDLMMAKMKENGHTPKKDLAELRQLQAKLRSKDTPAAKRQTLLMQLKRRAAAFGQAQREAMRSPKLRKARDDLMHATVNAMKDKHPETAQLIQQAQTKRHKLIQIRQSVMGHSGG
jgi:chromosome segregation ATPase